MLGLLQVVAVGLRLLRLLQTLHLALHGLRLQLQLRQLRRVHAGVAGGRARDHGALLLLLPGRGGPGLRVAVRVAVRVAGRGGVAAAVRARRVHRRDAATVPSAEAAAQAALEGSPAVAGQRGDGRGALRYVGGHLAEMALIAGHARHAARGRGVRGRVRAGAGGAWAVAGAGARARAQGQPRVPVAHGAVGPVGGPVRQGQGHKSASGNHRRAHLVLRVGLVGRVEVRRRGVPVRVLGGAWLSAGGSARRSAGGPA